MSRSNDPGHFFQSTSALEASERKAAKSTNKQGAPIVLPSKILAVIADPASENEGCVYVAESAGTARWLDLKPSHEASEQHSQEGAANEKLKKQKIYRGATAPLTSLAVSSDKSTLFAGCWDKSIWSWNTTSTQSKRRFTGHSDFVKSVACIPASAASPELLISGSADASIILWAANTGEKLHIIRGAERARGILDLAIDPSTLSYTPDSTRFTLYAGCSDPPIRRWAIAISPSKTDTAKSDVKVHQDNHDILAHETSVNALYFSPAPDDDDDDDSQATHPQPPFALFSASSDNTAKHLAPATAPSANTTSSQRAFKATATMPHPDFVRAVLVSAADNAVATGCRDGDVRVFDADQQGGAVVQPVHSFSGHFEEVTGLALVGGGVGLVSVSIDGTVRRWGGLGAAALAAAAEADAKANAEAEAEAGGESQVVPRQKIELTAEEEAELAELMSSDEDGE